MSTDNEFPVHPFAAIFPMMEDDAFKELVADINEHGCRESIIIWKDQLVDGRNRLNACKQLRLKPVTKILDSNADPEAFILSHNLHRRHLSESQRAMVGARLKESYDDQAKLRK